MKASVEIITPSLAKQMLKKNVDNRATKVKSIALLVRAMRSGEWKENGEAIIIDEKGVLKDGQHRLISCIEADYSFNCVVVRGVKSDVMSTIDIGMNRGLHDILYLNGFKNVTKLAAGIKAITLRREGRIGHKTRTMSNTEGLEFATENKELLMDYVNTIQSIYLKSQSVIPTSKGIMFLDAITKGKHPLEIHVSFMKELMVLTRSEGSGAGYVHEAMRKAKKDKIGLNPRWVYGVMVKAWNLYLQGNPPVKYLRYDLIHDLPKIM